VRDAVGCDVEVGGPEPEDDHEQGGDLRRKCQSSDE
jgi:hypothetical protein